MVGWDGVVFLIVCPQWTHIMRSCCMLQSFTCLFLDGPIHCCLFCNKVRHGEIVTACGDVPSSAAVWGSNLLSFFYESVSIDRQIVEATHSKEHMVDVNGNLPTTITNARDWSVALFFFCGISLSSTLMLAMTALKLEWAKAKLVLRWTVISWQVSLVSMKLWLKVFNSV